MMESTSASLLDRLKQPGQQEAWNCFADLYTPLIYYWARGQGLNEADASDLVQEVFLLLFRKMPQFTYQADGSFRSWLRTVTLNKYRELQRRRKPEGGGDRLDQLPAKDEQGNLSDMDYRSHVVRHMLRRLKSEFSPSTWQLFEDCMVAGHSPQEVADQRGVGLGTVYAAKSKVIIRLRQELQGLLD